METEVMLVDAALIRNRLRDRAARTQSVVLPSRAMWSKALWRGETVRCERGAVWLTQSGDAKDYILRAGENFTARRRGKVVVQAFEYSMLCMEKKR